MARYSNRYSDGNSSFSTFIGLVFSLTIVIGILAVALKMVDRHGPLCEATGWNTLNAQSVRGGYCASNGKAADRAESSSRSVTVSRTSDWKWPWSNWSGLEKVEDYAENSFLRELSEPIGRMKVTFDNGSTKGFTKECLAIALSSREVIADGDCVMLERKGTPVVKFAVTSAVYSPSERILGSGATYDVDLESIQNLPIEGTTNGVASVLLTEELDGEPSVGIFDDAIAEKQDLVAYYFPRGGKFSLVRRKCRAEGVAQEGVFAHNCNAKMGSIIGTALMDLRTGRIVGLQLGEMEKYTALTLLPIRGVRFDRYQLGKGFGPIVFGNASPKYVSEKLAPHFVSFRTAKWSFTENKNATLSFRSDDLSSTGNFVEMVKGVPAVFHTNTKFSFKFSDQDLTEIGLFRDLAFEADLIDDAKLEGSSEQQLADESINKKCNVFANEAFGQATRFWGVPDFKDPNSSESLEPPVEEPSAAAGSYAGLFTLPGRNETDKTARAKLIVSCEANKNITLTIPGTVSSS